MSTESNSLIKRDKQEVSVAIGTTRSISDVVTHEDKILTFDMFRGKRGDRGIWGRKIFFQALSNLGFVEKVGATYKPTEEAQSKYAHFFVLIDNTWGFNPDAENEIDNLLHMPMFKVQNELLSLHKEEKKAKDQARREKKRIKEKQNQKVGGLFL